LFSLRGRWGGWSTSRPSRFSPGKKTRYPFYMKMGSPGPIWTIAERFASQRDSIPEPYNLHHNDWAIPARTYNAMLTSPLFFPPLTRLIVKLLVRTTVYLITVLTEYTFLIPLTKLELKFSCVPHLDHRHCNKCNTFCYCTRTDI